MSHHRKNDPRLFQEECKVVSCATVAQSTVHLKLSSPKIASAILPGQMVFLRTSKQTSPLLRRPFAAFDAGEGILEILFEIVGKGTDILSRLRPDEGIDLLGPAGNGFPLPETGREKVVTVAGGMGLGPIHFLCRTLARRGQPVHLYYGAQTRAKIAMPSAPEGIAFNLSTDDGSLGRRGFTTTLLKKDRKQFVPGTTLYACGPEPMMQATAKIAARFRWNCFVSLEQHMACGVGACNGCVVDTIEVETGMPGHKRVCKEGPVFDAKELPWT